MPPKHHPTPLSGGDRKALAKELRKSRAMTTILASQASEAKAQGEALIRMADKLLCESWNERMEPDSGTTNIRNVNSAHWKRWLGPEHRCLVPFTSFSEYDTIDGRKVPVWFAPDESRPLLAFAGLWTNWTGVRKARRARSPPTSSRSSPASRMPKWPASIRKRCR